MIIDTKDAIATAKAVSEQNPGLTHQQLGKKVREAMGLDSATQPMTAKAIRARVASLKARAAKAKARSK